MRSELYLRAEKFRPFFYFRFYPPAFRVFCYSRPCPCRFVYTARAIKEALMRSIGAASDKTFLFSPQYDKISEKEICIINSHAETREHFIAAFVAGGDKNMARKIVITSGKGGVGKTALSCLLAARLAVRGERTIVCDADFSLCNAHLFSGLSDLIVYDAIDAIEGRCRAKQALVQHPLYPNFYLLPAVRSAPERYISPQSLKAVLDSLSPTFDYILIDCPSGADEGFHRAVACADEAILIATPDLMCLTDGDKIAGLLKSYALKDVKLIVNRVRGDLLLQEKSLSPWEISKLLKLPLLGIVPENDRVVKSGLKDPLCCIAPICDTLRGKKAKYYDVTAPFKGVFGGLKKRLRGNL